MRDSLFSSALHYFLFALTGILGLLVGIFIFTVAVFGILNLSDTGQPDINYNYTLAIAPNAENVRKVQSSSAPVILKINIEGVIGGEDLTQKTIVNQLIKSRERSLKGDRVKAIL